jgi:hypothetical protein
MTIKVNNEDVRIRPSSINGFFSCAYQWGKYHLEGVKSTSGCRAAIGTSIHAAVEQMWTDAMASGKKDPNLSKMTDAAMEAWKEEKQRGIKMDKGSTDGTAAVEILAGSEAFVEDIMPFAAIPKGVEKFYEVALDNPIVTSIGGTVDYITDNTIADVKTSKRKINANSHSTQQSMYKYLANANGENITHNLIQGVVLKKSGAEGSILPLESNEEEAKSRVNIILDTMDLIYRDVAPIETILRPNPGHFLCSAQYCDLYPCHAIKEL